MVKKGPKQPQRGNGQTLKVSEIRENYDAAAHGYTFFVTNPFLFVKKHDWWVVTVLKNIESAPGKPF